MGALNKASVLLKAQLSAEKVAAASNSQKDTLRLVTKNTNPIAAEQLSKQTAQDKVDATKKLAAAEATLVRARMQLIRAQRLAVESDRVAAAAAVNIIRTESRVQRDQLRVRREQ